MRGRIVVALMLVLSGCGNDRHDERLRAAGPNPTLDALLKVADANAGARKFSQCEGCHKISRDAPDIGGPNLHGVFGRRMGQGSARYSYTAALIDAGGRWDSRTLDAWIANPQEVVPGTKMQFAGVADPLDRADIIAFLKQQSD
ncbi:cytochrome c family protein [Sphingobium sp. EM0848]|uniref:c-type cytochrome n=1 Tax=Sphingobium sp. EM0848 TaxID=2743473 RepID=UPI00159CA8A1|nr:cytochrome c family protein [Sphingobium sp. EM0848]